jgi:hypothetical protein
VITVDGQAVNPGDDTANAVDEARLELKLCRVLAALNPPRDLSLMVHARAAELLRILRNHDVPDLDAIPVADLGDGELKEATGIVLAFRALPSCGVKGFHGGVSFSAVLGEYALDLAAELDNRTAGSEQPVSKST